MIDKFSLLFFGSDVFSTRVLGHILEARVCARIQIVTKPHTVLNKYAACHQLERYTWRPGLTNVDQDSYNIGLVASFGNLIDEQAVNRFRHGLFNVHPSLLPQYRGSTPVQTAILDGVPATGCTIMQIPPVAKFDIGDIIQQERLKVKRREYASDLMIRLADIGGQMAIKLLGDYESCMKLKRSQGTVNKSLARKLKPEQGQLRFRSEGRDLIDRKFRAYSSFIDVYIVCLDGMQVELNGMRDPQQEVDSWALDELVRPLNCTVKQESDTTTSVIESSNAEEPIPAGLMYFHKIRRLLCIKCADSKWHAFEWATPVGKPKMSATDFYNGYLSRLSLSCRMTDA